MEAMLEAIRPCGVALRDGVSPEALLRKQTPWDSGRSRAMVEKRGFEMLLVAMGDDPYDFEAGKALDPFSDDVWHFDVEFIEDHGAYKTIVERLCRMTGGDLAFDQVTDFVDVEREVAWVELARAGKVERIDLVVDNDWTDPAIFAEMQRRLGATGSVRRFAEQSLGQDCLIVCQPPEKLNALNRVAGLRFRVLKRRSSSREPDRPLADDASVEPDVQFERPAFSVAGAQFEIFRLAMRFAERRKARPVGRAQRDQRVGVLMMRRFGVFDNDRRLALAGDRVNFDFRRPFLAGDMHAMPFFERK
jgi:hypothetical protein